MNETFRLRKFVKVYGIFFTVAFAAATLASAALPFWPEPAPLGVKVGLACSGVAVFGTMTLLSIYTLVACRVEHFSVVGSTIAVRSIFQDRKFDNCEITKLIWKIAPIGGRIVFFVGDQKTALDLHGYTRSDRLRIIRLVRSLVPTVIQEGWPIFCQKIAIPLRDGMRPTPPKPANESVPAKPTEVSINRTRYDGAMVVLLPFSVAGAAALWKATGLVSFLFVLPLLTIGSWLLLRFSVPREGKRQDRLISTPVGQFQLFGWALVCSIKGTIVVAHLAGAVGNQACIVGLYVAVPAIIPFVYLMLRANRYQAAKEASAAIFVLDQWNCGETDSEDLQATEYPRTERVVRTESAILAS